MIVNLSRKKYLARAPLVADSLSMRIRGMIGRSFAGAPFDAMVFNRCNCIHTLFMKIPIDVAFIGNDSRICGLRHRVPPWTPYVRCGDAATTIELPADTLSLTGTEHGDIINLSSEVAPELEKELARKKIISPVETVISLSESKK